MQLLTQQRSQIIIFFSYLVHHFYETFQKLISV